MARRNAALAVEETTIVDGCYGAVRDTAVIQHVRDVEPVDSSLTHE